MGIVDLSRLEKVDLRDVWQTEDQDFTPWLAQEQNIKLLGDTIGLDLEVEAQEKSVGPFRADILCKNTLDDSWVLVENQLERTDHTHLGQLLTYASGLNTVTIVWIAERFTEEHRAALDWLNEITDTTFNFFGLEVELWRIGDSPIAPKFNMASKPNDWTKTISRAASRIQSDNLTDTKLLQLEYWTALREFIGKHSQIIKSQKPLPQHWTNFAIGRSHFHLTATANTWDKKISVILSLHGPDAKPHFHLLHKNKTEIEEALGPDISQSLEWRENPDNKESQVLIAANMDPTAKGQWELQHKWLLETLETFHKVFAPRVKEIRASDYAPESSS